MERLHPDIPDNPLKDATTPAGGRRRFVPWSEVERIITEAPLDAGFIKDVDDVLGDAVEEPRIHGTAERSPVEPPSGSS